MHGAADVSAALAAADETRFAQRAIFVHPVASRAVTDTCSIVARPAFVTARAAARCADRAG